MNLFEIIRIIILIIGWPFLIFGSIFILYEQIIINRKFKQPTLAKIMLIVIAAWIITMLSLGITATLLMFENVVLGVKVVLPIFIIWFVSMVILIMTAKRWDAEVLRRQNFYNQLTKGIKSIVNNDFSFEIKADPQKHDEININAVMFNKMIEEIKLSQEKLKKSNWAHVKKLENKVGELEKARSNLEEKLKDYM